MVAKAPGYNGSRTDTVFVALEELQPLAEDPTCMHKDLRGSVLIGNSEWHNQVKL